MWGDMAQSCRWAPAFGNERTPLSPRVIARITPAAGLVESPAYYI
jgi:hypothetical protein